MADPVTGIGPGAWWVDPDGQPGPALRECLAAATTAPSVMNTQPWLFHLRDGGIDVYADGERRLPVVDPAGRELLISVGAAIFNLRVAIRVRGRMPVQRLLPAGYAPNLAARITLGAAAPASPTSRAWAWAVNHRHSNRWPFANLAVPRHLLAELAAAAAAEGATFTVAGPALRETVLALTRTAERRWSDDPAYRRELARWTTGVRVTDGVPSSAFGPRSAELALPVRDFGLMRPSPKPRTAAFEATPTIAVLHAPDDRQHWLRTGQALQRILLTARLRGLAASLMTQALEIPRLRDQLTHPATGHAAQVVIRLGYGRRIAAASPRRPVAEVLLEPEPMGLATSGSSRWPRAVVR
jgi:Nitroreductase family